MPLLSLEPCVFPEDLLSTPVPATGAPSRWWVLHTKPRAEKMLARKCLSRNLSFYLPLHQKEWRSRGRLRHSHLPLFPGYLFLYGDAESRLQALATNLVVRSLV